MKIQKVIILVGNDIVQRYFRIQVVGFNLKLFHLIFDHVLFYRYFISCNNFKLSKGANKFLKQHEKSRTLLIFRGKKTNHLVLKIYKHGARKSISIGWFLKGSLT